SRMAHSGGIIALILAVLLGWGAIVRACNVPVFRYALERWQADPYRVTLFHRGTLTDAQRALLHPLEDASSGKSSANVVLRLVDVDDIKDDGDRAMFDAKAPSELPWLVVQYPQGLRIEKPVRSGPLAADAVATLVGSPLRVELIRRLAGGQTAVWLMLECGQADKDEAVAAQLTEELEQLAQRLQLPEMTSAPEDALLSTTPLQVTFSILRVPRSDAAEQALVEMLLGSESDLAELDEPMVFPVFGRGRALLPLIGAGITPDNIHESAAFLVGACSCEIKDLNPGFDLLLAANWDVLLFKEAPPPEILAARATVSSGKPQLVAIPAGAPLAAALSQEPDSSQDGWLVSSYVASIALVSLLLAVVVMAASKRFGRRQA
ncbi:MAG: hypothetical protein WD845_11740, partial [Pirellulales bacterium]